MQQLVQSIYPELADLGGCRSLEGALDEGVFFVGDTEYGLKDSRIEYDLQLTNTGEAVLVTGTATATVQTDCARCLEPAEAVVSGDVEGYFLLGQQDAPEDYEEDEFESVDAEGNIDLAPCIQAALTYAMPFAIYCKEDCLGLCPHCGGNLNNDECICEATDEPVDPTNPFAALAGLKFDED